MRLSEPIEPFVLSFEQWRNLSTKAAWSHDHLTAGPSFGAGYSTTKNNVFGEDTDKTTPLDPQIVKGEFFLFNFTASNDNCHLFLATQ